MSHDKTDSSGYRNYHAQNFATLLGNVMAAGSEEFAEDLAFGGTNPENLLKLAGEWESCGLTPEHLAADMRAIASDYTAVVG